MNAKNGKLCPMMQLRKGTIRGVRVYFDNAATTPVDKRVAEAIFPFLKDKFGNPSSVHWYGRESKVMIEDARDIAADYLGCKSKEIFFTSCGTESNNTAIKGIAFANIGNGKNHIITSTVEHPSVMDTIIYLKDKFGFEITLLKPDSKGRISPENVQNAIKPETLLISIMHSNNELGTINDIKKISEIAVNNSVYLHSDTVQSIGKTDINLHELGVNFASFSLHKIYGPKGIGMLYIKSKTETDKLLHGGGQEREMRGGTENVPYIAGLKRAIELLKEEDDTKLYKNLRRYLLEKLKENFQNGFEINSPLESSLDNILNIRFKSDVFNFIPDMLLIKLDLEGVALSGSSACSSGSLKASRILREIGLSEKDALSSIRISLGRFNTKADIDYFIEKLKKILFETK